MTESNLEAAATDQPELRLVGPSGAMAADSAFGVALVGLWHTCAEDDATPGSLGFVAPVDRTAIARKAAALVERIRLGGARGVALISGRRLVGFGELRFASGMEAHTGHLAAVMVLPELCRQGNGTRIVTSLLEQARERGLERLDLGALDGTGLSDFYARFGFTECGRRTGWFRYPGGEDRDEILMEIDLRSG